MTFDTTIETLIQPTSWLGLAAAGVKPRTTSLLTAPLITAQNKHFPRVFPTGVDDPAVLVVVDGGNSTLKIAVLVVGIDNTVAPQLLMRQVDVCYVIAEQNPGYVQAKFRINGGTAIHIGNPLAKGVQDIPSGSTAERMANSFYTDILFAAITDTLIEAYYQVPKVPLPIYFGYVVPSKEYSSGTSVSTTRNALEALRGQTITIDRDDQKGTQHWSLHVVNTLAAPQTFSIFYGMQRGVSGEVVLEGGRDIDIIDIGFESIQTLSVEGANEEEESIAITHTYAPGIISLTKLLIEKIEQDYGVSINSAQARSALVTNLCLFPDGTVQDISEYVDSVFNDAEDYIISPMDTKLLATRASVFVCAGGGAIKFAAAIEHWFGKETADGIPILVLPPNIASWANVVGGYAYIAHKLMEPPPLEAENSNQRELFELLDEPLKQRISELAAVLDQLPSRIFQSSLELGLDVAQILALQIAQQVEREPKRAQRLRLVYVQIRDYLRRHDQLP